MPNQKEKNAVADLTEAVEFLMVSVRELMMGRPLTHPQVQEHIEWAQRKLLPLNPAGRYEVQKVGDAAPPA